MNTLIKRSLIFVGLLVAGLILYTTWFGMKADRYDETVIPYLEDAIPRLTSWNFDKLAPLLSPEAKEEFNTEQGQAVYRLLSKLGSLQSVGTPKYLADKSDSSKGLGDKSMGSSLTLYTDEVQIHMI